MTTSRCCSDLALQVLENVRRGRRARFVFGTFRTGHVLLASGKFVSANVLSTCDTPSVGGPETCFDAPETRYTLKIPLGILRPSVRGN